MLISYFLRVVGCILCVYFFYLLAVDSAQQCRYSGADTLLMLTRGHRRIARLAVGRLLPS